MSIHSQLQTAVRKAQQASVFTGIWEFKQRSACIDLPLNEGITSKCHTNHPWGCQGWRALLQAEVKHNSTGHSGLEAEKAKNLAKVSFLQREVNEPATSSLASILLWELLSQDTCHVASYLWVNTQVVFFHRTGPTTGAQGHTHIANTRPTPIQTPVILTPHLCSEAWGWVKVDRSAKEDTSGLAANQPHLSYVSLGSQLNSPSLNFLHRKVWGWHRTRSDASFSGNNLLWFSLNWLSSHQLFLHTCSNVCVLFPHSQIDLVGDSTARSNLDPMDWTGNVVTRLNGILG